MYRLWKNEGLLVDDEVGGFVLEVLLLLLIHIFTVEKDGDLWRHVMKGSFLIP